MKTIPNRVELLAPAGSREAFEGALCAGADAVYLGGERFGARAYAANFSTEEILQAIRQAHVLDRKVYLTANVLTRESEMEDLIRFVRVLYEAGLDGVIVQDLGVLEALARFCPGLPLHASTQLSVTSAEAVQYLRRLGVRRVVPARELSLEEILLLKREDEKWLRGRAGQDPAGSRKPDRPMEIEAFIHGAMCYSYSGRCLLSSFLGGRSGNRGRCAGTCRLPYRILDARGRRVGPDAGKKEVYPLSMKDLCVLPILPELIDAGITSFKIEGRMKQPVYAAGVTAIYRKYIDRCTRWIEAGRPGAFRVEEEDLDRLRALYLRTSLGTGCYHAKNGRSLVTIGKPGYAGTDPGLEKEIRQKYLSGLPQREITGRAVLRTGAPARLLVRVQEVPSAGTGEIPQAAVQGPTVQAAAGRPLDPEDIRARLLKTGGSLFTFASLELEADENIFLPVSALNALRRDALQALEDRLARNREEEPRGDGRLARNREEESREGGQQARRCERQGPASASSASALSGGPCGGQKARGETRKPAAESLRGAAAQKHLWAIVSSPAQMRAAREAGCTGIVIDGAFAPDIGENAPSFIHYFRALPPVFRVSYRERIREMILEAEGRGFCGLLVRTLEELELVKQTGYAGQILADASLYAWNGRSMAALARDCGRIVAPLELEEKGIRRAARAADAILRADGPGDGRWNAGAVPVTDRLILPVYGRIPMMESAGCIRKTENLCSREQRAGAEKPEGFWYLEDRMGKRLPVRCRCAECSNTVYNAVPLSLHQAAGQGLAREVPVFLCMFTTESGRETVEILRFFRGLVEEDGGGDSAGRSGRRKQAGSSSDRRTAGAGLPFREFTNGHFKTGAV